MGLVVRISYCYKWEVTYFVQCANEREAKLKAYKMFKDTESCYLPDTLDDADKDNDFSCEVIAKVEQIIL